MLETIREFAREQLDASGETEETRRRHANFYLEFGETMAARLGGAAMAETLTRLATELPNLRAALDWSLEPGGDADSGLRLATALSPFWRFRGHLSEGRRWLDTALAAGPIPMTTRIDGLVAAAEVAIFQGEYAAALRLGQEALHLATVHGYPGGEARVVHACDGQRVSRRPRPGATAPSESRGADQGSRRDALDQPTGGVFG